ncbi:MAG: pyridoxamine 5'-phosphate oxidase family protein [Actinomycetota bacterium]|nr:pyridoxamine 5'-phosphate oxidase family protein [Acidimicrobiia bacterium]MDQ3469707.1 pyridoxamine 5'-phosphate oxidase family protein [Actinomycetota bacterium]
MLEPAIRDLASTGKNFAVLAVHLPNGQIANHVMWIDASDEQLLVNTEIHRAKYKAMQQRPEVTITIWDAENPYRYAEVRGTVSGQVRGDEARAHIDTLSQRYLGHDYATQVQSERVVLRIDPVRQRATL